MWQLKSPFPRRTMLYIHAHCVGPVRRVRLKGADTTCEAFTLIIPTKEALVSAEEMQAERAPFPWRRLLRNLSQADSVIGHLASFPLDGNWRCPICKFEKGEFCRILVSGVCLLIFMKVNIHQREGARVVASELSLAKSILRIISLLLSYWILIWGLELRGKERERELWKNMEI